MKYIKHHLTALLAVFLLFMPRTAQALTFTFSDGKSMVSLQKTNPTLYTQIRAGIEEAGRYVSARVSTPVNVTVLVEYRSQSGIASTSAPAINLSYNNYRLALRDRQKPLSATDTAVVASMPLLNPVYTVRNPGVTIYNSVLSLPQALAKALGQKTPPTISDGAITISSKYKYDFDRSDGITAGQYDFTGIVAHELLHVMGIRSGVLNVDGGGKAVYPYALDLFRWSVGADGKAVRDMSADKVAKFFSLKGELTPYLFSTGIKYGNKQSPDHWYPGVNGVMIPQTPTGKRLDATELDWMVMDALGWTITKAEGVTP
jgi:hypothetical protein